jgi:hypothetical protein
MTKPYTSTQTEADLLRQWTERCAVQKCDPECQAPLLDFLGKRLNNVLSRWGDLGKPFKAELLNGDAQVHRIAFYDHLFYNYEQPSDQQTRALKANLLRKADGHLTSNVRLRLQSLVRKRIIEDSGLRRGVHISSLDDSILFPNDFEDFSADLPGKVVLSDIATLLDDPEFNSAAQRFYWLRFYPSLLDSPELDGFCGVKKTQVYAKSAPHLAYVKQWFERHHPGASRTENVHLCRHLCYLIEEKLLTEHAIPEAWLTTLNHPPDQL